MIRLSLHPLPAYETSAFNKIRAFNTRRAGLFPFRISVSSRSRSSPLSLTTYFFTEISFAAMIAPFAGRGDEANHQIPSNWLKRATTLTRIKSRTKRNQSDQSDRSKSFFNSLPFDPRFQLDLQTVGDFKSRPQESAQADKWSFCQTAGTLCPANQERQ
jgi:hypothetical protein